MMMMTLLYNMMMTLWQVTGDTWPPDTDTAVQCLVYEEVSAVYCCVNIICHVSDTFLHICTLHHRFFVNQYCKVWGRKILWFSSLLDGNLPSRPKLSFWGWDHCITSHNQHQAPSTAASQHIISTKHQAPSTTASQHIISTKHQKSFDC